VRGFKISITYKKGMRRKKTTAGGALKNILARPSPNSFYQKAAKEFRGKLARTSPWWES